MPFASAKQRRYLWSKRPDIARRWTDEYGSAVRKEQRPMQFITLTPAQQAEWFGQDSRGRSEMFRRVAAENAAKRESRRKFEEDFERDTGRKLPTDAHELHQALELRAASGRPAPQGRKRERASVERPAVKASVINERQRADMLVSYRNRHRESQNRFAKSYRGSGAMDLVEIAFSKGVPSVVRRTGRWPDGLTYKRLSQDRGERAAAAYAGHPNAGAIRTTGLREPVAGRPGDVSERGTFRAEFGRGDGPGYAASGRHYADLGRSATSRGRYAQDSRTVAERLRDRKRAQADAAWAAQSRVSMTSLDDFKRAQAAAAAERGTEGSRTGGRGLGGIVRSIRRRDR